MPHGIQQPALTPLIRRRLKEKFPRLLDSDLPSSEIAADELVARIARRTRRVPERVRQELYAIGALVTPRTATSDMPAPSPEEPSLGSGVPDDTGQSGMMAMGPGW